jgi:hypothetical protein
MNVSVGEPLPGWLYGPATDSLFEDTFSFFAQHFQALILLGVIGGSKMLSELEWGTVLVLAR